MVEERSIAPFYILFLLLTSRCHRRGIKLKLTLKIRQRQLVVRPARAQLEREAAGSVPLVVVKQTNPDVEGKHTMGWIAAYSMRRHQSLVRD